MRKDQKKAAAGRVGAFVQHSRHDPVATTAKARATFLSRFEDEVDPDRSLSPKERARRAEAARRAYFTRLSMKAAKAKAARKKAVKRGEGS